MTDRFLGRTHAQNIRAPRTLVQISSNSDPENQSSIFREPKTIILGTIEAALTSLLDVEDIKLALEHTSANFANELKRRLDDIAFKLVSSLKMVPNQFNAEEGPYILKISKYSKGVRLIAKAIRLLPEPHFPIIIDNCLANWEMLLATIEDEGDKNLLVSVLEKKIAEISPYGLVQRLQFSTLKFDQLQSTLRTEVII